MMNVGSCILNRVGLVSIRHENGSRVLWLSGRICPNDAFLLLFRPLLLLLVVADGGCGLIGFRVLWCLLLMMMMFIRVYRDGRCCFVH